MELNRWWTQRENEIFWLVVADSPDLGTDLYAPQLRDDGKEYYGYSLIREITAGDLVLHYSKIEQAIVIISLATGKYWGDDITWGAHGTTARGAGVRPYSRKGWRHKLSISIPIPQPVTLLELRQNQEKIGSIRRDLESVYPGGLYFPFETPTKRELRPTQAYLTKMPKAVVELFPSLVDAILTKLPQDERFWSLKNELQQQVKDDIEGLQEEENTEFTGMEGIKRTRFVNYYERNPRLRAEAIRIHGTKCQGCGFDFEVVYGIRGRGYIEVHHLKPVSSLGDATEINPSKDMSVLCANCHRIIHRKKDEILTLDELRHLIRQRS